jgi:hypothetical protein
MVPSSLGDMYAKFLSAADREIAIDQQPFFFDGATVRLVREEEADRVPCDMQFIAVVLARRMPVEHLSSLGVHSAFACFGQTLEVDISGLAGTDCSVVRAVVLLKHAQQVPPEVLVTRDPWPSRLISIRKLHVWRRAESYNEVGEYIPFFGAPPPPLYRRRAGNLSLAPLPMPPAPALAHALGGGGLYGNNLDEVDAVRHSQLLALLDSVASSGARSPLSSSSSGSLASWGSGVGSDSASGSLGSGPPISATRRHCVVITEIVDGDAASVDPPGDAASEEDRRSSLMRHGVDYEKHRPVGNPKRKV